MKIYIDEQELEFHSDKEESDDNIVQIAKRHGINITAPCFLGNNGLGCCASCLIKVDGKEAYACATKARDGMKIKYDDPFLSEKRHDNIRKYKQSLKKHKQVLADHARLSGRSIDFANINKK